MVYHDAAIVIASVSIVIYLTLFGICVHYARKFWEVLKGRVEGGLYAHAKFVFFVVLGLSALLELPVFIGCLIHQGPYQCVWNEDGTHNFAWACHWIASCGFMYSVMSTAILWSDVIQHKDGHFFNSVYPLDKIKFRFRVAFIVYCIVVIVTLLTVVIDESAEKHAEPHTHSSKAISALSYCVVPIILVLITCGCFHAGLRLQSHVISMQLDTPTLHKILFKLNATLFTICASYIIRAILLLSLFDEMPTTYTTAFVSTWHYSVWVPITQWFPYVFCSFCLIDQMKFRASAARKESTNSNNVELNHAERTFSVDSVCSDTSHNGISSYISGGMGSGMGVSGGVSGDTPTKSLAYLVSQLGSTSTSGVSESSDVYSGNGINMDNNVHSGDTSTQEENYFDTPGSPSTPYSPGPYSPHPSHTSDSTGMDHFFTTSALHSRSNSVAQP